MSTTGNSASGTGAPTDASGQQPAVTTTNGTAVADSSTSSAPSNPASAAQDSTVQNPEAQRYAKEAAEYRSKLRQVESELKKHQDSQLSAQQKLERDFADMQAKNFEYETRLQQQALKLAGYEHGATLGISDIKAALALVQVEHAHEIKYSDDGTPENIADLLKAVIKEHPFLGGQSQAQTQRQQAAAASSGGATNPGRQASTGAVTRSAYASMTPQERILRNKDILASIAANGGRLPD